MAGFIIMRFHESTGHYPFMKAKAKTSDADSDIHSGSESQQGGALEAKAPIQEKTSAVAATQ